MLQRPSCRTFIRNTTGSNNSTAMPKYSQLNIPLDSIRLFRYKDNEFHQ
jgi:hypothetical protein